MALTQLDPNEFQEVGAPVQSNLQQVTDVSEELPAYASGQSPETPINKSPIDEADRARYSLGNAAGIEKDLQMKFPEGVQKDAHGNMLVKKEGLWYAADPKGTGDGDAWERTQELIKDATDIAPQLLKNAAIGAVMGRKAGIIGAVTGAIVGAGATAATDYYEQDINDYVKENPVKSAAAATILGAVGIRGLKTQGLGAITKEALPGMIIGAGAEAARTSLGRLVGTYDATPWEQAKDIGFESLMNLGNSAIAAGVRPTGETLANAIKTMAKGFSEAPEQALAMAKAIHGPLSGVGDMNIDTIAKNSVEVPAILKNALKSTESNQAAIGSIIMDQVGDAKKIVGEIQPALSKQYLSMSRAAVESVPEDFIGSQRELVQSTWNRAAEMGLGKMQMAAGAPGQAPKLVGFRMGDDKALSTAAAKLLQAGRTQEAEMVQSLIGNEQAKGYLSSFFKTVGAHNASPDQTGQMGARALVGFKKAISGRIEDLKSQAAKDGAMSVRTILKTLDDHLDGAIEARFQPKSGGPNLFTQFNSAYQQMKGAVQPLLDVRDSALNQRSDQPYVSLINQLSSDARSGLLKRGAFHNLLTQVNPVTKEPLFSKDLSAIYSKFLNRESAKAFIPGVRPGALGKYGPVGAVVGGITNPKLGATIAGGLIATSPRLTAKAIVAEQAAAQFLKGKDAAVKQFVNNAIQKAGDTNAGRIITDVGFKGLKMTQDLVANGRIGELLRNEQLMRAYSQTLLNGFTGVYQTKQQLLSQVPGQQ